MTAWTTACLKRSWRRGANTGARRISQAIGISRPRRRASSSRKRVDCGTQPCGSKNANPSGGANLCSAPATRSRLPQRRCWRARISGEMFSRSHLAFGRCRWRSSASEATSGVEVHEEALGDDEYTLGGVRHGCQDLSSGVQVSHVQRDTLDRAGWPFTGECFVLEADVPGRSGSIHLTSAGRASR
jgi:hypothetical protein